MLTVKFAGGEEALNLYKVLGLDEPPKNCNFFMFDDEEAVALWRMKIAVDTEPVAVIEKIHFLDSVTEDDRRFFYHAILFKLIEGSPILLRVEGVHDEFKKFGFKEKDGNMEVYSKDVNLYYACGGR